MVLVRGVEIVVRIVRISEGFRESMGLTKSLWAQAGPTAHYAREKFSTTNLEPNDKLYSQPNQ